MQQEDLGRVWSGKTGKKAAWRCKAAVQSQKVQLLTAKSSRKNSKAPDVQLLGRMQDAGPWQQLLSIPRARWD